MYWGKKNMKIEKIKNVIVLMNNEEEIERYDLQKEINFSGLMKKLLSSNLHEKFILEPYNKKDYSTIENNLISLILEILDKYNSKVDEFETFISNNE